MSSEYLISLLKKKGTGAKMGQSLTSDELSHVRQIIFDSTHSLSTRATLVTALKMLPNTLEEQLFLDQLELPDILNQAFNGTAEELDSINQQIIQYIDLSEADMIAGIDYLFDQSIPNHKKAIFLEALRLKRETSLENKIAYDKFYARSYHHSVSTPLLIDLSNPYDGFTRNPHYLLKLAPLLASIGFPTYIHGIDNIGPKFGLNFNKLLDHHNKNPFQSISQCISDLEDPDIAWTYIDQSVFFPDLFALKQLRIDMVKRPFISTIEKLLSPLRAERNYIITGYTHPPYKEKMATLISESAYFDGGLIVRGVEGSIQLPLDRKSRIYPLNNNDFFINPTIIDTITFSSEESHCLVYMAAVFLHNLELMDITHSVPLLHESIISGRHDNHWMKGCAHEPC